MSIEISIKKAAIINFVFKYLTIFVQILYMAVLARILSPKDFGVVAIITVFTTFFIIFTDIGIGASIIQDKSLRHEDIENIFSFSFYLAISLALAFSLFSVPLSVIYINDIYKPLGLILAISLFFNTLNTVPNALLLRQKRFMSVGIRMVIVTFISSLFTIVLAYIGLKYYSIALNSVMTAFFTFVWNYKSSPVKFRFRFKKDSIIKIKAYSGFLFGFNVINYFSRNLDNLIVGKLLGDIPLAYYDKAYRLMLYPVQNLTHIITPVLHPILSEYQNDKNYVYDKFVSTVRILSLIGIFVGTYCFFAANEIILIVFGYKWQASVPIFRCLSLSIWAQMISSTSGSIFQSLGKTKLQFIRGILVAAITISAILIGVSTGDLGKVAVCIAIAYNLHFLSMLYFLIHRGVQQSSLDFCKKLIPDMIIVIMMVIGMNVARIIVIDNLLLSALYKGIVCGAIYGLGLIVTKQYKILLNLLRKR
jgi:teichuronic acid exporter